MIGKAYWATFKYYDSSMHKMAFKKRLILIIGQADSKALNKIDESNTAGENFIKYNTARLQEGVAVIEPDKEPRLLADDNRSIMSHLHGTKTYILREYNVD